MVYKTWQLPLNINKCNIITFTLQKNPINFNYMIENPLERATQVKDLGVIITNKFSYSIHISNMIKSAFKVLGMLRRKSANFNDSNTVLTLYKALVRSRLDYASIIWNSDVKNTIY